MHYGEFSEIAHQGSLIPKSILIFLIYLGLIIIGFPDNSITPFYHNDYKLKNSQQLTCEKGPP